MDDLAPLRKEIEGIDADIVKLLIRRNDAAKKVGDLKKELGIPLRNLEVEREVIERYGRMAENSSLPKDIAEAVCKLLITASVDLQAPAVRKKIEKSVTVIGGKGNMGVWLCEYFKSLGSSVGVVDIGEGSVNDAKDSDIVVISVPIPSVDRVLNDIDAICRKDALIFDISSLKGPFASRLKEMAKHRKICSVHPMFGPSAVSMADRNVIICGCGCDEAVTEAKELFDNDCSNILITDLDRHDELMAYVLAFSHAANIVFFTTLKNSGISFKELKNAASTTFNGCVGTSVPVSRENSSLYHDIQYLNGNTEDMWKVYENAVKEVKEAALSGNVKKFIELMEQGKRYFRDE
ncbi:MAG: prephenate dehydrogenase/arogenate dehydrogenase family protein [Methanomassiliicoccaceae archaeon]|nr:prephenate dehydrogenase/arogenate dehydrogenase family protein [Methanomassiliicoccaceae archaeon]